jgi:DNA polymerase III alpha subunit
MDIQDQSIGGDNWLFESRGDLPWKPTDYSAGRRRADEWELLGFVADQPMMALFRHLLPGDLVRSVDLPQHKGRRIRTAGIAATGRTVQTTQGLEMQFITLEDEWGLMELTVFPRTHAQMQCLLLGPYLVVGTVQEQYGVFGVTVEKISLVPNEGDRLRVALLDHSCHIESRRKEG